MDFFEDASFLRLQDVSLSYRLSENILKKIKFNKAEIFVDLKNMATWTNWKGLDPEFLAIAPVNHQRATPQVKSFIIGLKIGF